MRLCIDMPSYSFSCDEEKIIKAREKLKNLFDKLDTDSMTDVVQRMIDLTMISTKDDVKKLISEGIVKE